MRKFLESLQQKEDHQKRQIAFLASTGCMVVIAGIWVMTLSVRFDAMTAITGVQGTEASTVTNSDQTAAVTSPFESLQDNFKSGLNDISESIETGGPTQMPDVPPQFNSSLNQESFTSNDVIITDPSSY